MGLSSASVIQEIVDALGVADAATYAQTNVGTSNSTAERLRFARQTVYSNLTEDVDTDQIITLVGAMAGNEDSLTTYLSGQLSASAKALNAYYKSVYNLGLKAYAKSLCHDAVPPSLVYSAGFRGLWRRTVGEELLTRLYYATKGVSSWNATIIDQYISLATQLEVRVPANAQSLTASITVNMTLYVNGVATDVCSITIPSTASPGDAFAIRGNAGGTTFSDVNITSITGGAPNDMIDIWVA